MSELTASDVLAMNNSKGGLFGENGIWFIVLILFFLGGFGGGFGGWGNNASQGALTRAELYDGLNSQNTFSEFRSMQSDINNGFNSVNQNINNASASNALALNSGFSGVQIGMNNGFNGVMSGMNAGFNGIQSSIADSRYAMQSCCCEIKNTIHSEGEATRALIQENTIQALRDAVADKDRELLTTGLVAAQTVQTNNLENFMRTLVNGCGCGA